METVLMPSHHKRNAVYCDWDDVLARARRQSVTTVLPYGVKIEINQYGTIECVLEDVNATKTTTVPETSETGKSNITTVTK